MSAPGPARDEGDRGDAPPGEPRRAGSTRAEAAPAATVTAGDRNERYREIRFVTLVGSVIDLALGVVKLMVGYAAHSQSLIADGVHSLSDLATDVFVVWAAKHAHRGPDDDHPYGHARIETAATVGLGIALILVAAGIAGDAVHRMFNPEELLVPGPLALWAAFASVVLKEAIYHYTMRSARRLRSSMLRANAWHSRSDAISSIVVIVGVGGSMLGLPYVDAVAAVVVAWMIARIGWGQAWHSVRELIDTGLSEQDVTDIRDTIMSVDGVADLHLLRTRRMGGKALVDVHILLTDPRLSVSEGHQISEAVRGRLMRRIEDVEDVTVHIDPEDDEHAAPSRHLPGRGKVMADLQRRWEGIPQSTGIRRVTLHYVDGRIEVEVLLPLELAGAAGGDPATLARRLAAAAADAPYVSRVEVLFGGRTDKVRSAENALE